MRITRRIDGAVFLILVSSMAATAFAGEARQTPPADRQSEPFSLSANEPVEKTTSAPAAPAADTAESSRYGYREISDFFNIREANPQVDRGEWEFEIESRWFTHSDGEDDEFGLAQTLKYGITDDLFVELEVVQPSLGDGRDQGNGDIVLVLFNRFVRETESIPAIGGFVEMRVPSGQGSSGVDASFNLIVTKTIVDRFRVHFEGFVETANGSPNGDDDRRPFQWGVGPGFDYQFDDRTIGLVNYLNRSSEDRGQHNENILEFGVVHEIYHQGDVHQHVKFVVDVGLDGQPETPNLGAKFQYSIDWK